jgi:hypothetical protein
MVQAQSREKEVRRRPGIPDDAKGVIVNVRCIV